MTQVPETVIYKGKEIVMVGMRTDDKGADKENSRIVVMNEVKQSLQSRAGLPRPFGSCKDDMNERYYWLK